MYGTCKICGCTDTTPCIHPDFGACFWLDESHDICSHCVELKDDPAVKRPDAINNMPKIQFEYNDRNTIDEIHLSK